LSLQSWCHPQKSWPCLDFFRLANLASVLYPKQGETTGLRRDRALTKSISLEKASKMTPIWLRIPLVAGFNDSADHIKKIAHLGKNVGAQKISFLPYHEGGRSKSEQLGRPDQLLEVEAPSDEHIQTLKGIVEREGLKVTIGN
jgi:pyruvate formate lyase activating enzyme